MTWIAISIYLLPAAVTAYISHRITKAFYKRKINKIQTPKTK